MWWSDFDPETDYYPVPRLLCALALPYRVLCVSTTLALTTCKLETRVLPCHDLWMLTYQVPRGCFGDTTDRGTPSNPAFFKVSVVSSSHIL